MSLELASLEETQHLEVRAELESAPDPAVQSSMRESEESLPSHTDTSLARVVVKSEPEDEHERTTVSSGSSGNNTSSSSTSKVKCGRVGEEEVEPSVYFPSAVKTEPDSESPGDHEDEGEATSSRYPTVVMRGENFYVEVDPDFEEESPRGTDAKLDGRERERDEGEMSAASVSSVSVIKYRGSAHCESAWRCNEDGVLTDVNMMHASYRGDGKGRKARRKGVRSRRKGSHSTACQSRNSTVSHLSWANEDSVVNGASRARSSAVGSSSLMDEDCVLNGASQPRSSTVGSSSWTDEDCVRNGKDSPPQVHGVYSPLQDCQEHPLAAGFQNDSEDSWDFSGGGGKLYCLECKKDFDRMSDFEQHIETVHGKERRFGCPDCGRRFSRRNHLNRHVEVLHGEGKKYSCPECLKKFSSKEYLKTHQNSVHGEEKAYMCPECGKKFGWKSYLKLHMVTIHAGEKKFSCSLCSKKFGWKSHLITHMEVIHENERKHSCPRCGRRFSSKAYLKTHLFTVHENEDTQPAKEGGDGGDQGSKKMDWEAEQASESRYSCQRCDRTFTLRSNLTRHMKTVHGGEKKYQCTDCGKQFGQKSNLDTHVKTVHSGLKEFVCSDCGREFTVKRSLKIHCAIVHRGQRMQGLTRS